MNTRLVAGFFCFLLCVAGIDAGGDAKPPPVEVAQPIARAIIDYETVRGRVEAAESVELRARVTGYLMKINFKPGADVNKGDILFEIDDRPYRAALMAAEAHVAVAEAQAKLADAEYARAERLVATKAISREEIDRIKASQLAAKAKLVAIDAERMVARLNFEYTKIVAPLAGKIGKAEVSAGNLVRADETLLADVASVAPVHVYFHLDERTILRVWQLMRQHKNKDAPIPVSMALADDTEFPHGGKVDFLNNRVDPKTGTIRCRAVFPNADGALLPGTFARVRLPTSAPYQALLIDARVVMPYKRPHGHVFVVNEKDIVETREVELEWHDQWANVKSGLKPADWVVVKGGQALKPGMQVQVIRVQMPKPEAARPEKKVAGELPQPSARIKGLMKERHAVLTKAADVVRVQYQAGLAPLSAVLQARQAVIEAGFELCETHAERIALLRQNLKVAEEIFKLTQAQLKVDRNGETGLLQAQATLLEAQIRLLREEQKEKAGK